MRTIKEILDEIKYKYVNNSTIRERYGITGDVAFDEVFAQVSVESVLFYIIAVAIYAVEFLFSNHIEEVNSRESAMRMGTKEWWINLCKSFQFGGELVYDDNTNNFKYSVVDIEKQIIKYATIRECNTGIEILVNRADADGLPEKIENEHERNGFEKYLIKNKIAGIPVLWNSFNPDELSVSLNVVYDPLMIDNEGASLTDGIIPVDDAIIEYINSVAYGDGKINKTQLLNAIEKAPGVIDVYPKNIDWLRVRIEGENSFSVVSVQDLKSHGGAFTIKKEFINVTYISECSN